MVIWSGWGILVAVFAAVGLLIAISATEALQQWLPYGPAGSVAFVIGGLASAAAIHFFARWRERGEGRTLVDEATGERVQVRPSAGSFFFIPTRYWPWIVVVVFAVLAVMQFNATPLYGN